VEAVAYHHQPSRSVNNTFTPLTAVHIADALVAEGSSGATCKENLQLDVKYLIRLGLTDHLESWRQVYDEVLGTEELENE
jgi:hypothetical protein